MRPWDHMKVPALGLLRRLVNPLDHLFGNDRVILRGNEQQIPRNPAKIPQASDSFQLPGRRMAAEKSGPKGIR